MFLDDVVMIGHLGDDSKISILMSHSWILDDDPIVGT